MRTPESQEKLNHYSQQLFYARKKYAEAQEDLKYYRSLVAQYSAKYNQGLKDPNFDLFKEMFQTN